MILLWFLFIREIVRNYFSIVFGLILQRYQFQNRQNLLTFWITGMVILILGWTFLGPLVPKWQETEPLYQSLAKPMMKNSKRSFKHNWQNTFYQFWGSKSSIFKWHTKKNCKSETSFGHYVVIPSNDPAIFHFITYIVFVREAKNCRAIGQNDVKISNGISLNVFTLLNL